MLIIIPESIKKTLKLFDKDYEVYNHIELRTGCVYQIITEQSEIIAFDLNGDSDYSSGTVIK